MCESTPHDMSNGPAKTVIVAVVLLQWLLRETPVAAGPAMMNVLAVQSVPSKSRWNVMRVTLRALTDRGHNVTVFTPFLDGEREHYTEVKVSFANPAVDIDVMRIVDTFTATRAVVTQLVNGSRNDCNMILRQPRMKQILLRGTAAGFDVFITDPIMSECMSYVATELRVPLVHVLPPPIITYLERLFYGHVPNPAVVAHVLYRHGGVPKTFTERLANTLLTVHCSILIWYSDRQNRLSDPQPYDHVDLVKPSVTFSNTHFITEPSRPLTPDIVQVGGLHLPQPKGIPKDILEFIEDSPHGVIYFTFGSVVLMSSLPDNLQNAFKDVFAQIPQRVLWKYEGEMKDKPKNVMTKKWFPQRDILLHPNVKLFISHGGISGVYEAVDAGVPVLGFPFFYDQPKNLGNLVDAGMAISMDLMTVNEDALLNAVLELINDQRYRKNAKIASDRFKDRPMSPAQSIVYWTEYVVRHKGAPHLKSHAINLMWYEYFLVVEIATLLFAAITVLLMIYFSLKIIYLYMFKNFQNTKRKRE